MDKEMRTIEHPKFPTNVFRKYVDVEEIEESEPTHTIEQTAGATQHKKFWLRFGVLFVIAVAIECYIIWPLRL
jgi:hypothetical protein